MTYPGWNDPAATIRKLQARIAARDTEIETTYGDLNTLLDHIHTSHDIAEHLENINRLLDQNQTDRTTIRDLTAQLQHRQPVREDEPA